MAYAEVEERQLLKAMTWWDGFVVALANPGFLIAALGASIGVLGTTGAAAVMVGRAAQGNPWALTQIMGNDEEPTREEVVAELLLFVRETVRELGDQRAFGFLKKFYGWYLGRGRFPRPFKQELVMLSSLDEVEERLLAAAPGARFVLERLLSELPDPADDVLLDSLPISIYGGG